MAFSFRFQNLNYSELNSKQKSQITVYHVFKFCENKVIKYLPDKEDAF